ncbi:MAG TPA: PAS domain-containing protein [Verrucomicrobiae bacterium]|nr:PAS domain-containing protein [Verrucomicrobiae bacterium]
MKAFSLSSLRVRLVLLVLLAVIPALGLILYTARVQRLVATEAAYENLSRTANLTATDVSGVMDGAQQLLGGLAQFREIRSDNPESCSTVMTKLLAMYSFYSTLGVASPDGTVVCSAVPLTNSVTVADQSWFHNAVKSREFAIGEWQTDRLTGKPCVDFASPISDGNGPVQSVVFAALDLRYLNRRISRIRLPEGATSVVFDRQGAILARSPETNWHIQSTPELFPFRAMAGSRGQGTMQIADTNGVQQIYAFSPINGKRGAADAYVSVSIPTEIALVDANKQLAHNLLGLTVVSLLALAAAWFGGHTIVLGKANDELERRVRERTKELAHEQLLLRMLMDNIPDTIYFKDTQSRFTRVNRAQAEVLGLKSADQAVGKTDFDFFTAEHAKAALADEQRILESGERLISKTERIRRADGQFRWVTATKVPLRDTEGISVGLVGISRDVTEHEMTEHLLHNLLDSLPDLVYVKDTQGRYLMDNPSHRAFLGLRTVEDIAGKTDFDLYPQEVAERIRADDQAVLDAKIPRLNREEQLADQRGEKVVVYASKVPYRDEEGKIAGLVCVSRIIDKK